eukprot:1156599-Pelagomonas_calceolata.AAC.3
MAETTVNYQPPGLFNPFLLQCYSFGTRSLNHPKTPNVVQWVVRCGVLVCYRKPRQPEEPTFENSPSQDTYTGSMQKAPDFGAQITPSAIFLTIPMESKSNSQSQELEPGAASHPLVYTTFHC